jgi:hypothetical protein
MHYKSPKLSVDNFALNHYYTLSDDGSRKRRAKRNGGWPRRRVRHGFNDSASLRLASNDSMLYQVKVLYDPGAAIWSFSGPFGPFCRKSSQVPFHKPFTRQTELFPIKVNQTKSNQIKVLF